MPPRSSFATPRGGSMGTPSRGRRGRPSANGRAGASQHLLSPPPSFDTSDVITPVHRHTSPVPKGRRGRQSGGNANDPAHSSSVVPESPDPLAMSVSPEVIKRGRKRKSALPDPDEPTPGEQRAGDGSEMKQELSQAIEGTGDNGEPKKVEDFTEEEKQDMWLDFAAERYEIVEQLPLELHRNFRLLRELDDGCISQSEKLQEQIRAYIAARFELVRRIDAVAEALASSDAANPQQEPSIGVESDVTSSAAEQSKGDDRKQEEEADPIAPSDEEIEATKAPDGDGDVQMEELVPQATDTCGTAAQVTNVQQTDEAATTGTPDATPVPQSAVEDPASDQADDEIGGGADEVPTSGLKAQTTTETSSIAPAVPADAVAVTSQGSDTANRPRPARFLPEIGRLAREIVRNCEEKVAVAQGAYNSIDRHIRALDSHLSAQEASLILGLRPDTLPSAGADAAALGPAIGAEAGLGQAMPGEGDGEVLSLGIGGAVSGGRGRTRKRKGKPGRKGAASEALQGPVVDPVAELGMGVFGALAFEVADADPNEPRYCYCNRVSYGDMVACENDDCPLEWFHLPCTGLTDAPQGKWWCNVCNPKPGFVPPGETVFLAAQAAKEGSAAASGAAAGAGRPKKKGRRR